MVKVTPVAILILGYYSWRGVCRHTAPNDNFVYLINANLVYSIMLAIITVSMQKLSGILLLRTLCS